MSSAALYRKALEEGRHWRLVDRAQLAQFLLAVYGTMVSIYRAALIQSVVLIDDTDRKAAEHTINNAGEEKWHNKA